MNGIRGPNLLAEATRFLSGDRTGVPDAAFAAALLTREALERELRAWARIALGTDLRGVSGRAQLAVVEEHIGDRAIARRARFAWHELSSAVHHGPSFVDPAAVVRLHADVRALVAGLAADLGARRSETTPAATRQG